MFVFFVFYCIYKQFLFYKNIDLRWSGSLEKLILNSRNFEKLCLKLHWEKLGLRRGYLM